MIPEHSLGEVVLQMLCHGLALGPGGALTAEGRAAVEAAAQSWGRGERSVEIALTPRWRVEISLLSSPVTKVHLQSDGARLALALDEDHHHVTLVPRPAFLDEPTPSGAPRSSLVRTHANFLIFHPIELHPEGAERRLMITPPGSAEPVPLSFEDALDTVSASLHAAETDCILLRWHSRVTGGEVDQAIGPLLRAVKRNYDVVVAVECPPPRDLATMDLLYGWGVDAVSVPVLALRGSKGDCPERLAPLDDTLRVLERAVAVYPRGTIIGPLLIGLESPHDTLSAITRLASLGVRAGFDLRLVQDRWDDLRRRWTNEDLQRLWEHLEEELDHHRLASPWTPHPWAEANQIPASAFQVGEPCEPLRGGFWQTRPGQVIVRNLIRLRRRLRVRRVDQSLESSEL